MEKERKIQIIRTALKRFVKHGIKKTTLDEVARDLRIGKATLYHYFHSKEDLYYQTLQFEISIYLGDIKSIFEKQENEFKEKLTEIILLKDNFHTKYKLIHQLVLNILSEEHFRNEKDIFTELLTNEKKLMMYFFSKELSKKDYSAEELASLLNVYCWGRIFLNKIQAEEYLVNSKNIITELVAKYI